MKRLRVTVEIKLGLQNLLRLIRGGWVVFMVDVVEKDDGLEADAATWGVASKREIHLTPAPIRRKNQPVSRADVPRETDSGIATQHDVELEEE